MNRDDICKWKYMIIPQVGENNELSSLLPYWSSKQSINRVSFFLVPTVVIRYWAKWGCAAWGWPTRTTPAPAARSCWPSWRAAPCPCWAPRSDPRWRTRCPAPHWPRPGDRWWPRWTWRPAGPRLWGWCWLCPGDPGPRGQALACHGQSPGRRTGTFASPPDNNMGHVLLLLNTAALSSMDPSRRRQKVGQERYIGWCMDVWLGQADKNHGFLSLFD